MFRNWRARTHAWSVLASSRTGAVVVAGLFIAGIAFVDQRTSLSFGLLYLFPVIFVGTVLPRWQVVLAAAVCAWLTAMFNRFPFAPAESLAQDALVFVALAGTGLVASELTRSRRREIEHARDVECEMAARRGAEEQLTFLITTSPAAIVTVDAGGDVVLANGAAHRLFGVAPDRLPGQPIGHYMPALGHVPSGSRMSQTVQTEMQCRGERADGSVFLANVFFSTYNTASGPRLAALIVDASAELLDREESNLEQLLAGSRVLVAAVSHEVRNLCGAMGVIYENLARSGRLTGDKDFAALGSLVETLTRIACVPLRHRAEPPRVAGHDLVEILEDLRIVLDPYCADAGIAVDWRYDVPNELPAVWADRHHLLQVLLNLTKNSQRALRASHDKRIAITVSVRTGVVSLRVTDTGPGPSNPDSLFQVFQKGADATGLGLYLSRALLRSFHGDLKYDAAAPGCSFVIDLAVVNVREHSADGAGNYDDSQSPHEPHPAVAG